MKVIIYETVCARANASRIRQSSTSNILYYKIYILCRRNVGNKKQTTYIKTKYNIYIFSIISTCILLWWNQIIINSFNFI